MRQGAIFPWTASVLIGLGWLGGGSWEQGNAQTQAPQRALSENDCQIDAHAQRMMDQGRQLFRFDTFGPEAFGGDALQPLKPIAGEKTGGFGGGMSPTIELSVGLKLDAGGFYHDGRLATLTDVLLHFDRHFTLGVSDPEEGDLIEYLKSR